MISLALLCPDGLCFAVVLQVSDLKLLIRGSAVVKPEVSEAEDGSLLVTYVRTCSCIQSFGCQIIPSILTAMACIAYELRTYHRMV